jgi:hypothetical protein
VPNTNSAVVRPQTRRREENGIQNSSRAKRLGRRERRAIAARAGMMSSAATSVVEPLEERQLMSISVDSGGWTTYAPSSGARVIYVSSSQGSDSNSGLSASSPVSSLARAQKLLHSGTGDELLLKRGDTWHSGFGFWGVSGQSSSNPLVIGAYGTGSRPTIDSGNQTGWTNGLTNVHDIAFIGLHFTAAGRGGATPDGIQSSGRLSGVLIEDCCVEGYRNNITLQSFFTPINNVKVRRSQILDAYSSNSHAQGIYADGVHGLLLEQNVFDHNGWGHGAGATMFNHGAYVTAKSSGLTATGNIFSNSSSHGLQARPGGTVTNNLFYNNAIGLSFCLVNGGGSVTPGGVTGTVSNNVFVGGHSISGLPAGVGVEVSNIKAASVSNNVFAYGDPGSRNAAINLSPIQGTTNGGSAVGINNLTISNNVVYKWSQGMQISGGVAIRNLSVRGNDFQNITAFQALVVAGGGSSGSWSGNTFNVPGNSKTPILVGGRATSLSGLSNSAVHYPDVSRTVNTYDSNLLAKARALSHTNWDVRCLAQNVVAWIQGGFKGGGSVPVISVPSDVKTTPSGSGVLGSSGSSSNPSVTVNDVTATEGNYGSKSFTFTVRLSKASSKTVTVRWQTKGHTATPGADYYGTHSTLTFSPGQTSKTVSVKVYGDRKHEASETFGLQLLGATNANIGRFEGKGTIVNDD